MQCPSLDPRLKNENERKIAIKDTVEITGKFRHGLYIR